MMVLLRSCCKFSISSSPPFHCSSSVNHSETRMQNSIFMSQSLVISSVSTNYLRPIKCYDKSSRSSMASDKSPATGVFIKGLPLSMSERRLKMAFSEFGEVQQVEIIVENKSQQPIGHAFVWFTSEDSTNLALKEMNGKFFDGRFILVTIANLELSKAEKREKPWKF